MNPMRLFILGALDARGEMHGHQLRLQAEEERIHLWADVTVGGLYGAIKRLANEGLIREVRTEREGNYPERQVYAITEEGRTALGVQRDEGLRSIVFRPDPFDLALTRLDPDGLDRLGPTLELRILGLERLLAEQEAMLVRAAPHLSIAETWVMHHRADRIRAEIASHRTLLSLVPEIIDDELARKADPQ